MSSFGRGAVTPLSYGQAAFATGQQIRRALEGDARRVQFVIKGQVVIQFDAVMQEGHQVECGPTVFPVEDGGTISDHVILAPVELGLTAVITDSPLIADNALGRQTALLKEGVTSVANAALGPAGVLGTTAAFMLAQPGKGTLSRSFSAFETLRKLAEGEPNAETPVPPVPFDVVTRLRTYNNMVIRSLQAPRDATTGSALVFQIQLTQMRLVQPQTLTLALSKIPDVASIKEKMSEEDAYLENQFKAGDNKVYSLAGKDLPFASAGVVP